MNTRHILFYNPANGKTSSLYAEIENAGYMCKHATSREEALQLLKEDPAQAVLIYLDNCGDDGLKLCHLVRQNPHLRKTALIVISAENDEDKIVETFEAGADEYLTNFHSSRELLARIRAILRRINGFDFNKLRVKDIEIDLEKHKVKRSGRLIDLTYIQFKLLYLLASQRESVFSRREILDKVWGKNVYVTYRTVDVHIKRLREKLGEYKYPSQYIETVHGTGYRLMQ